MSGIQTNGNEVRFHRVSVLPTTLEPRAWYIVASGNNAELYITDNNGVPKRATNSTVIQEMIDAVIGNIDFYTNEDAQDAVGAALTDTDTIDLIYDDVNNLFKADVKPNSITATELANNINISEFVNNVGYELQSNKGIANGYTPLNSNVKIPLVYIDDALLGNVQYHGLYDGIVISGSTDIPPLDGQVLPAPSLANKGWYFISNADYTYSGTDYKTGDWIISSGAVWSKVDNTDAVTTVFGRTGNITAQLGDYTASLITNTPFGNISSTNVQAALNELDSEKAIDANVIHKTGSEFNLTGTKSFDVTTGIALRTNISGSGYGNYADNSSNGISYYSTSSGQGKGFVASNNLGSLGFLFEGRYNGGTNFIVNHLGETTGTKFIKSGGLSTEFLKADGSVDSTTYTPTSRTLTINGVAQDLSTNRSWRTAQASSGVYIYGGATQASGTQVNVGAITGVIVTNESVLGTSTFLDVSFPATNNITVPTLGSGLGTYVLLNSSNALVFQNTFPTPQQRRQMVYLFKIGHPTGTITTVINEPDFSIAPLSQFRDWMQAINYINQGVYTNLNGANLQLNLSGGEVVGNGINLTNSVYAPNNLAVLPATPVSWLYRTDTGAGGGLVNTIQPGNYSVGGVVTAYGGSPLQATLQYIYYVPGSVASLIIQYGQTIYSTLSNAIAAVGKETRIIYPSLVRNAILINILAVTKGCTDLSDTNNARLFYADMFGQAGGASAGISTATLQSSYNNSLAPQITTTTALGAVEIRRGSTADTDIVFKTSNGAGTTTASINGSGGFTGTSWNGYIPANDTAVIHNTGNESFTGIKSATNTGTSVINGLSFINSATNVLTGVINVQNTSSGIGIRTSISSTGPAFVADAIGGAGGFLFAGRNAGSDTFTVNRLGEITGTLYTGGAVLTGIPTAPTAIAGTNTTQIATTAFVNGAFVTLATSQTITGIKTFNNSIFTNSILQFTASTASSTQVNACIGRESSGHIRINSAGKDPIILNGSLISAGGGDKTFTFPNQSGTFALTSDLTNHITGSLTTNYIPKTTGVNSLGNSLIYDNGTNVGIGTTSPVYNLDVKGGDGNGVRFVGTSNVGVQLGVSSTLGQIGTTSSHDLALLTGAVERARITTGGNVLIGTATDDGLRKLQVAGDVALKDASYTLYTSNIAPWSGNVNVNLGGSGNNFIVNGGNVGIGTINPLYPLQVKVLTDTNIQFRDTGYGIAGASLIQSVNNANTVLRPLELGASVFSFNGGNVLIGTITDNGVDKLQVNGSGVFGKQDYSFQAIQRVLTLNGDGVSAAYAPNSYRFYTTPGQLNSAQKLTIRAEHGGTESSDLFTLTGDGVLKLNSLAGTGTRTVVADASGNLSAPVSDERLKENIQPLEYGLAEIMKMKPVSYTFKDKEKYGENTYLGNIAQNMAEIIPEATFTNESTGMMGIEYSHLHAVYIKAIQDQQKIIEKLEERILQLENK